jgi:hypothetical protein
MLSKNATQLKEKKSFILILFTVQRSIQCIESDWARDLLHREAPYLVALVIAEFNAV